MVCPPVLPAAAEATDEATDEATVTDDDRSHRGLRRLFELSRAHFRSMSDFDYDTWRRALTQPLARAAVIDREMLAKLESVWEQVLRPVPHPQPLQSRSFFSRGESRLFDLLSRGESRHFKEYVRATYWVLATDLYFTVHAN